MQNNLTIQKEPNENFHEIFSDMRQQFPENELKSLEEFSSLLQHPDYNFFSILDRGKKVGYFISYFDKKNNSHWIDYFAIKKDFQSLGYGKTFIYNLKMYFPSANGFFFEVEKEDEGNPNTIRRAKFYQEAGACKANIDYFLPTKDGFLPMDLYFYPCLLKKTDKSRIMDVIKNAFKHIHSNRAHAKDVYKKIH